MHFNIYLDNETALQLQQATETSNISRNAIIRQAISSWLKHNHKKQWPEQIINFTGIVDFPAFESHRSELSSPKEDPFQ